MRKVIFFLLLSAAGFQNGFCTQTKAAASAEQRIIECQMEFQTLVVNSSTDLVHIDIYDADSRLVFSKAFDSTNSTSIDLSELGSGSFLAVVLSRSESRNFEFSL
jgi:hypothetical protein